MTIHDQYIDLKRENPSALLLMKIGDFYEAFDSGAGNLAQVCDLILTERRTKNGEKYQMSGFPYHRLESNIDKLVKNGYTVAVAEQRAGSGTVERYIRRVIREVAR